MLFYSLAALSLLVLHTVRAYIPAEGSNETTVTFHDSSIVLRWTDQGYYREQISRQLTRDGGSEGISRGALVHFIENATILPSQEYSITPWIALVSCDKNSTDASMVDDVFTLARDRGAVAALLYSTTSATCILNPWYSNPDAFDRVLDIYTTITKSSARLIESQFENVNRTNYFFNASRLNQTYEDVSSAVAGHGVDPGYLIATVKIANVSDPFDGMSDGNGTDTPKHNNQGDGKSQTSLAMIILYAITGCVSALFCVVIISGAIRAIRHPERYGPRAGDPNILGPEGEPQTRTRGLTRAILDTFPVVKFGGSNTGRTSYQTDNQPPAPKAQSPKSEGFPNAEPGPSMELKTRSQPGSSNVPMAECRQISDPGIIASQAWDRLQIANLPVGPALQGDPGPEYAQGLSSQNPLLTHVNPQSIGHHVCPICILDFEEGDDLRVLPCEGKHTFHRDCVDPWLLELSSSCPLCRKDFQALEHMVASNPPDQAQQGSSTPDHPGTSHRSRFYKYLRSEHRPFDRTVFRRPSQRTLGAQDDGHQSHTS